MHDPDVLFNSVLSICSAISLEELSRREVLVLSPKKKKKKKKERGGGGGGTVVHTKDSGEK